MQEIIKGVIDSYLDQMHRDDEVDSDDLADNIATRLTRFGYGPKPVVKLHWESQLAHLKEQLAKTPKEAEKEPSEFRSAWKSGVYRHTAEEALKLADKIMEAAKGGESRD